MFQMYILSSNFLQNYRYLFENNDNIIITIILYNGQLRSVYITTYSYFLWYLPCGIDLQHTW